MTIQRPNPGMRTAVALRPASNDCRSRSKQDRRQAGSIVVELAVLAPLLVMLFVITVDFARIYYVSVTLTNCARSGALYASDPATADESPFASTTEAALSEAQDLSPQPTITETSGADGSNRAWVEVSAQLTFRTITGFPGIPKEMTLTRTVRMNRAAITPDN